MPQFSAKSYSALSTCDARLQNLFMEVIKTWDCTVLEGTRTPGQQVLNVQKGVSKTMNSKHLLTPSLAVDVAPYPLEWPQKPKNDSAAEMTRWMKEYALFYYFAGYVLGVAEKMGYKVRWLGDNDGDHDIKEQNWDDLVHWESSEEI